jgi:hypothetical protein
MPDFTSFYRRRLSTSSSWPDYGWDLFISAYNESERVRTVFDLALARSKHWLVHSEYAFDESELPSGDVYIPPVGNDEAEFLRGYFDWSAVDVGSLHVCVDATGWMRPHLMLLLRFLMERGVRRFDVLYAEPDQYAQKEKTTFASNPHVVRPVLGFEGLNNPDTSRDLLVIGAGYDDALISHAAEHKRAARKVQMFGFPPLRPDMYQENLLRARKAAEAVGEYGTSAAGRIVAPANDPFVVAEVLKSAVERERESQGITNLYLCPLATKPQALGFALYYLYECVDSATTIIFPFAERYSRETSIGLSNVTRYTVELPEP